MTGSEIRQKYLDFFEKRGHKIVPSSSLVPENDPSTLFTSSGMQPMVPYLLGQPHPEGTRLTDSQKCIRTQDIEEVGDNRHDSFFEMLGNWSLGDYWKKEQIAWIFEFFTDELNLDPHKLYVSVFSGNDQFDQDDEAIKIWQELFNKHQIKAEIGDRIRPYGVDKNWWSRSGPPDKMPEGEPGGPSSEVFYEFTDIEHNPEYGKECHPNCDCGRFLEIGNNVFMQFQKQADGSFKELPKKNVDFGGGLERGAAALNNDPDIFKTDLFWPIIQKLETITGLLYDENKQKNASFQIVADHLRASVFLIKDGVVPSNKLQGYVLRRLLRRAAVKINSLKEDAMEQLTDLIGPVISIYQGTGYFEDHDHQVIRQVIYEELSKFSKTITKGLKEIAKIPQIDGKLAFDLYQTYGFPLEITTELFLEKGQQIDLEQFETEFKKHQELSRSTSAGVFKGGLADHSEETTKLHTATHLLNQALHQVLGEHIIQRGSNITAERLRFDFPHPQKLTAEEISQIEEVVNEQVKKDLPVTFQTEDRDQALKSGARAAFGERYPDQVTVYSIGDFSKEICGGPHVKQTGTLGQFKITKEEAISSGIRRIYAILS